VLLQYRLSYSGLDKNYTLKVTTWDALGYYMYLPSAFIYNDATQLKWFPDIDKKYQVSGGWVYQANIYKKTNKYVFKYLGGEAIIEMPFFLIGHVIAKTFHYDADGFSPPYQYAIAFGILFYCLLSVILLRKILLRFFDDITTAVTLLLVMLATNIIQYVAIDSAQSHGIIFPLYALILYVTIKWHEKPRLFWACAIGYIIGLAAICRPTEAVILFIPLLWGTQTKESAKEKWSLVKQNKKHIWYAMFFVFLGVLPQLIYWQIATGFFIYDVGSKWSFLNPFFSVLFGFESGWFIYTPVTIFFIWGMFYMSPKEPFGKPYPFKKAVIWFCILNIYIIISWFDGNPDSTYSCRRLSQSYPVFALPLAAFIERINLIKMPSWHRIGKITFYILGLYLIGVNLFQIGQYASTVLHYTDMNRKYYGKIYLNPNPTPLDMSLLDTNEFLSNEKKYQMEIIAHADTLHHLQAGPNTPCQLLETTIDPYAAKSTDAEEWLKVEAQIKTDNGFWGGYLGSDLIMGNTVQHNKVRLFRPLASAGIMCKYAYYIKVPNYSGKNILKLYVHSIGDLDGIADSIKITTFKK